MEESLQNSTALLFLHYRVDGGKSTIYLKGIFPNLASTPKSPIRQSRFHQELHFRHCAHGFSLQSLPRTILLHKTGRQLQFTGIRNMEKYFQRTKRPFTTTTSQDSQPQSQSQPVVGSSSTPTEPLYEDVNDIIGDPGLRKCINEYEPRIRDEVRRKYVQMGPCQPISHVYPKIKLADRMTAFQVNWFKKWEWLEYSIDKDAAFCFWCYLFGDTKVRDEVFTKKGFRNWKKASEKFGDHIGSEGSAHKNARTSYFAFKDQRQSVTRKISSGTQVLNSAYRTRLTASVDVVRLLLTCGLAFRGHDESTHSLNRDQQRTRTAANVKWTDQTCC